jgi:hypothetical protein
MRGTYLFRLWPIALGIALAMTAKPLSAQSTSASSPGCPILIDSVLTLFTRNDPQFLFIAVDDQQCSPKEMHTIYYYQALGYLILDKRPEAKAHLRGALAFEGPYREEAWYQLWKTSQLDRDAMTAAQAIIGLYQEWPRSTHLPEMLASTNSVGRNPTPKPTATTPQRTWSLASAHSFTASHEPGYARQSADNRITWSNTYRSGTAIFNPSVQFATVHDMDTTFPWQWQYAPEWSSYSGTASLNYLQGWFFTSATLGFSYNFFRHYYSDLVGTGLIASLVGWNVPQAGFSVGARLPLSNDHASLLIFASANRFHESLKNISLNLSLNHANRYFKNNMSASVERLYFDFPVDSLPSFNDFVLAAPLKSSQVSHNLGLYAGEGVYSIEGQRGRWHSTLSLAYRKEWELVSQATDSVRWIYAEDSAQSFNQFYGEVATTEDRITVTEDIAAILSPHFTLRLSTRLGYLWVLPQLSATSNRGWVYRGYLGLTTLF